MLSTSKKFQEGFIGFGLSMDLPVCPSIRGLHLHSFENHQRVESWNFICRIIMLIEELFFFFVAFGVAELQPFIIFLF